MQMYRTKQATYKGLASKKSARKFLVLKIKFHVVDLYTNKTQVSCIGKNLLQMQRKKSFCSDL